MASRATIYYCCRSIISSPRVSWPPTSSPQSPSFSGRVTLVGDLTCVCVQFFRLLQSALAVPYSYVLRLLGYFSCRRLSFIHSAASNSHSNLVYEKVVLYYATLYWSTSIHDLNRYTLHHSLPAVATARFVLFVLAILVVFVTVLTYFCPVLKVPCNKVPVSIISKWKQERG